jgi:hypothetical protein
MYRLLVALQPEDANAMQVAPLEAARLVELKNVRDGALRSQDEVTDQPRIVAGSKRPIHALEDTNADAPAAARAKK